MFRNKRWNGGFSKVSTDVFGKRPELFAITIGEYFIFDMVVEGIIEQMNLVNNFKMRLTQAEGSEK